MPIDGEHQIRDSYIELEEEEALDPDFGAEAYNPDIDDDMDNA